MSIIQNQHASQLAHDGPQHDNIFKVNHKDAKAAGYKFFYTGVRCKQGHLALRHVGQGDCSECRKAYNRGRDWTGKLKVSNKAYCRKYQQDNRLLKFSIDSVSRLGSSFRKERLNAKNIETTLGYTNDQFKAHLESQFTGLMSWDNYGDYWEIDHIVPVSHYCETMSSEALLSILITMNRLDNLQPLTIEENREKRDRM